MNEPFETGLKPKTVIVIGNGNPSLYNTPKLNNYAWYKKHVRAAFVDKTGTIVGLDHLLIDHVSYYLANQLPSHIDIMGAKPTPPVPVVQSNEDSVVAIIAIVAYTLLIFCLTWLILS